MGTISIRQVSNPRQLIWTTSPDSPRELRRAGYEVFDFAELRKSFIEPARRTTTSRASLRRAAETWLGTLDEKRKLAVLNVPTATLGDLVDVYGYLIEPAFRRDTDLLLGVDQPIDQLTDRADPGMGYPWTRHRLHHTAENYRRTQTDRLPPMTPIEMRLLDALRQLDLSPQVQFGIGPYRVDFAFPDRGLAVEADGRAWHDAERDRRRDRHLHSLGWRVVRFSGSRIHRDANGVAEEVKRQLAERDSVVFGYSPRVSSPESWIRRLISWVRRLFSREALPKDDLDDDTPHETGPQNSALDTHQRAAVHAFDGVVQVIAPAGSGKTTTMVARVQELLSRGIPATRILCTTFNKESANDLQAKLRAIGVRDVEARTFHSVGHRILKEEGLLRGTIRPASHTELSRIARLAKDNVVDGIWIEPPAAAEAVSDLKLAKLWTPAEAAAAAHGALERTRAEIYRLLDEAFEERDCFDFDDLILKSVNLLREDPVARSRWQDRWECVLVDEYQDIEPAQEVLIHLLAAPEDSIFVVGDEDQCIYSWRRASVERIVMLDTVYPGLERVVLETSYRCPPAIVEAASRLIAFNRRRFPKVIRSAIDPSEPGRIEVVPCSDEIEAGVHVAELLKEFDPNASVVVLARTSRLLRELARACVGLGVPVRAPAAALHLGDAEETVLAYLRLVDDPRTATAEDVKRATNVPNSYLPAGAESNVATALRSGLGFVQAIETVEVRPSDEWRLPKLQGWAEFMATLTGVPATKTIKALRAEGGLDRHYSSVERMSPHDQVEIEALNDLTNIAGNKSVREVIEILEGRARLLSQATSGEGIELTTIHGAKGREWGTVILFGADDDQMPHLRGLMEATDETAFEATIEDERRLAYVAVTRTKQRLVVVHGPSPSPFLQEAGIIDQGPSLRDFSEVSKFREKMDPAVSRNGGKTVGKPQSIRTMRARYAGKCQSCHKAIRVDDQIANVNGVWIHGTCASDSLRKSV